MCEVTWKDNFSEGGHRAEEEEEEEEKRKSFAW